MAEGWSIDPKNPSRAVYTDAEGNVLQEAFKDEAVATAPPQTTVKNKGAARVQAPVTAPSRVRPTAPQSQQVAAPVPSTPKPKVGGDEELKFWDEAPADIDKPRRLSEDDERAHAEFIQLNAGNPNFSQEDLNDFWRMRGYPGGANAADPQFIADVRAGKKVGTGVDYSLWDRQQEAERKQAADAYGQTVDGDQGRFSREYNEAVQYGFNGIVGRYANDWLDTGKEELRKQYPGQSDEWYEQQADQLVSKGQRAIRDYYEAKSEADPTWKPDESFVKNVVSGRWIPSVAGAVLGSPGPESLLMPGGTAAARIGGQVGISGAAELGYEIADKAAGVSDEVSATNVLAAAGLGGLFQGGDEAIKGLLKGMKSKGPEVLVEEAGSPISPEDFAGLEQKLNGPEAAAPETPPATRDVEEEEFVQKAILAAAEKEGLESPEQIQAALSNPDFQKRVRYELTEQGQTPGLIDKEMAPDEGFEGSVLEQSGIEPQKFKPVSNDAAIERVEELSSRWKNAPEFEVVSSVDEIADPKIRAAVDDPSIVGFYGPDGKVRLISGNLENVDQVAPALFHESLGHHGLRQKFGDELDNFMTRLHKGSPELRAAVDEWKAQSGKDYGDIPLATQVEEVLASMSEGGQLSRTLTDRVKDWLKNFARNKLKLDLDFSPREVNSILAQAHQMVTAGKDTGVSPEGYRFIRAFHVSPNNFEKFDRRYRGQGEGAQAYGQGHYFTESPEVRDSYREFFTNNEVTVNGKPSNTVGLAAAVSDRIWNDNTHLQSNMIGQNVLGRSNEMAWTAASLALGRGKIPTPRELLAHLGLGMEDKGLARAAEITVDALKNTEYSVKAKKPTTFEVELPDDGKWIVRDEPIANQPDLRKLFEDDGFTFRSPDDIDEIKREIADLDWEIRSASDKDYLGLEEKRFILQDQLDSAIPDDLKADQLEPELAAHGMTDQDVADWLEERGFTGFKYKDGFSRSGKKVTPTYNYVVFGDDVPQIVNKYMKRDRLDKKPVDLNNIRTTKDLGQAIKDMAEAEGEYNFDPQSMAESMELGERLGLTPDKLARRKMVSLERAPEFMAAVSEVLVKQEAKVRDLARAIAEGDDSSATVQAATEELAKLGAIVPQAMRFNSAAGRALNAVGQLKRAGRGPQEILEAMQSYAGATLDRNTILKLMARVNEMEDPADVAKLATDAFNPRAEDYIFSAWYNMNLLSRLSTQMNNIIGTGGHLAAELGSQHIAWALGLPKKLTGNTNRIATRELVARYAGLAAGVLQGLKHAPEAFRLGMPISGPSKEAYRPLPLWEAAQKFNGSGVGGKMPQMIQNTVNEAAVIAELPSRMMAVTDEFFRSLATLSDYYGRAARDVLSGVDEGTGTLGERFYSLSRLPTEEMKKVGEAYAVPANAKRNENLTAAHELARRVTFRDELTDVGKGVEDKLRAKETDSLGMRGLRFSGRVVVPFYRMGERMLAAINRYTPGTGLASRVNRAGFTGGGAERDTAIGRQLFGIGLGMLAVNQVLAGQRSGEGPSDYERRSELEASGWRPNSVLMEDGTWFKTDNLDPINAYMNAIATAMEQYEEGMLDDEGYLSKAEDLTNAFTKWATSAAGLESVFRMAGGVEDKDDSGSSNAKAGIIASFATPGAMQAYTQNFDDTAVRSTSGDKSLEDRTIGRIQSAFPSDLVNRMGFGGSKDLPQRFNPFGQGVTRKGGWLGFLFGDRFTESSKDPAIKEVVRLGDALKGKPVVGYPSRTLQLGSGENRKIKKLNEAEFQNYVELSGSWFKNGLTNEMNKPGYKQLSDQGKRAMIKDIASQARKAAREYLFIREVPEGEPDTTDPLIDALQADANAQPIAIPEGGPYGDEE